MSQQPSLVAEDANHPDTWTPLEVGARLGWTDRQASLRLTQAVDSLKHTHRLVDLAGAGGLEARKFTAVSDILADAPELPAKVAAQIEAEVLAGSPEQATSTKLRHRTGRLLAKHAPIAADEAATMRRRDYTDVTVEPHWEPGMSIISASLPSLDAARLMAAINTHARLLHQDTTTDKPWGQCRVDALTDLLLTDVQVKTELVFQVPIEQSTPAPTLIPVTSDGPTHCAEYTIDGLCVQFLPDCPSLRTSSRPSTPP